MTTNKKPWELDWDSEVIDDSQVSSSNKKPWELDWDYKPKAENALMPQETPVDKSILDKVIDSAPFDYLQSVGTGTGLTKIGQGIATALGSLIPDTTTSEEWTDPRTGEVFKQESPLQGEGLLDAYHRGIAKQKQHEDEIAERSPYMSSLGKLQGLLTAGSAISKGIGVAGKAITGGYSLPGVSTSILSPILRGGAAGTSMAGVETGIKALEGEDITVSDTLSRLGSGALFGAGTSGLLAGAQKGIKALSNIKKSSPSEMLKAIKGAFKAERKGISVEVENTKKAMEQSIRDTYTGLKGQIEKAGKAIDDIVDNSKAKINLTEQFKTYNKQLDELAKTKGLSKDRAKAISDIKKEIEAFENSGLSNLSAKEATRVQRDLYDITKSAYEGNKFQSTEMAKNFSNFSKEIKKHIDTSLGDDFKDVNSAYHRLKDTAREAGFKKLGSSNPLMDVAEENKMFNQLTNKYIQSADPQAGGYLEAVKQVEALKNAVLPQAQNLPELAELAKIAKKSAQVLNTSNPIKGIVGGIETLAMKTGKFTGKVAREIDTGLASDITALKATSKGIATGFKKLSNLINNKNTDKVVDFINKITPGSEHLKTALQEAIKSPDRKRETMLWVLYKNPMYRKELDKILGSEAE